MIRLIRNLFVVFLDCNSREHNNGDACSIMSTSTAQDSGNDCNSQNQQTIPNTIISNKSTKRIYKDLAKQWGITCQMSEQCRCMDCQGQYFKCDYHGEVSRFLELLKFDSLCLRLLINFVFISRRGT